MKCWDKLKMKSIFNNLGYFLKEVKIMIHLNLSSHILSLISIGLVFFILAMVLAGWWVSSQVIEIIQGESEISVYIDENIDSIHALQIVERINEIESVRDARIVNEAEAYDSMAEILGEDAHILEYFDDNPFSSFIEVKIDLEKIDRVLEELQFVEEIEYVRDNREVLNRLHSILEILKVLGYLVVAAVGITTLVIISHIIRLGIYNSREQINTLRLLGAPESFISFPFLTEGLVLTLGGGIFAACLSTFTIKYMYTKMATPFPFIPLPPCEELVSNLIILVILLSSLIGIMGSILGLSSSKSS